MLLLLHGLLTLRFHADMTVNEVIRLFNMFMSTVQQSAETLI